MMSDPKVVRCTACNWWTYEGGVCVECRRREGRAA